MLRGPQGTRYGANALGGLIYMQSMPPTEAFAADFEATAGNDGTLALGAAVGGPIDDSLRYRASLHQYQSDGFRHNAYLGRDDTYGRDELSARGKLDVGAERSSRRRFRGTVRRRRQRLRRVGHRQRLHDVLRQARQAMHNARSQARFEFSRSSPAFDLVSISGAAQTDATFSFDADWGNDEYWAPVVYDYITTNERDRRTYNQEVRLLSKPGAIARGRGDWLIGVYALDLEESNDQLDAGILDDDVFAIPACSTIRW